MDDHDLVAAILADPDDPQPYLVYADWLQANGDPRGELIVLEHRGALVEAKAHRERHAEQLIGPLAPFLTSQGRGRSATLVWQWGFMTRLTIGWGMYQHGGTRASATAELVEILRHPSARFITELELGPAPSDDIMELQCLVDALVTTGRPEALRAITLGEISDWDISTTATGDFGALAAHFKRLRDVTLRGGKVTIGELDLPELTSFAVCTGGLDKANIQAICDAKWPELERLEIWFGVSDYGGDGELSDIAPILAGRGLGKLVHLGLMNCPWADDIARALAGSKILGQLSSLDLSMGALSDAGIAAMAESGAFAHLASLNVGDSALTTAGVKRALTLAKSVEVRRQDPKRVDGDGEPRYVSVSE